MIPVTTIILCGGSGNRLWPFFPKQFLSFTGNESLFQQAAQRLVALGTNDIQVAKPLIVTSEEHHFLTSEHLREAGIELGAALHAVWPGEPADCQAALVCAQRPRCVLKWAKH